MRSTWTQPERRRLATPPLLFNAALGRGWSHSPLSLHGPQHRRGRPVRHFPPGHSSHPSQRWQRDTSWTTWLSSDP